VGAVSEMSPQTWRRSFPRSLLMHASRLTVAAGWPGGRLRPFGITLAGVLLFAELCQQYQPAYRNREPNRAGAPRIGLSRPLGQRNVAKDAFLTRTGAAG
jgi:hypothetical protein